MEFTKEEYRLIMEMAKFWHFEKAETEEEKEHAYDIYMKAHDVIKNYELD